MTNKYKVITLKIIIIYHLRSLVPFMANVTESAKKSMLLFMKSRSSRWANMRHLV